jgi:hypothetical protein
MRRLRVVVETADATRLVNAAAEMEPTLLRGSPALQFRIGKGRLSGNCTRGISARRSTSCS